MKISASDIIMPNGIGLPDMFNVFKNKIDMLRTTQPWECVTNYSIPEIPVGSVAKLELAEADMNFGIHDTGVSNNNINFNPNSANNLILGLSGNMLFVNTDTQPHIMDVRFSLASITQDGTETRQSSTTRDIYIEVPANAKAYSAAIGLNWFIPIGNTTYGYSIYMGIANSVPTVTQSFHRQNRLDIRLTPKSIR